MTVERRTVRTALLIALVAVVFAIAAPAGASRSESRRPSDPTGVRELYRQIDEPLQKLYMQTLGRPDGGEMVYYISGAVYPYVAGNPFQFSGLPHGGNPFNPANQPILGFEGFNIRKFVRTSDNELVLTTREIVFYTDPATGEILDAWTNPLTGVEHPVVPVNNDWVNSTWGVQDGQFGSPTSFGFFPAPEPTQRIADEYVWSSDIFPQYSLADRYGIDDPMGLSLDATGQPRYTSAEIFDFYVPTREERTRARSKRAPRGVASVKNSWTRVGPPVPWMCLDESATDVQLTYHARSTLLDSFDELPDAIRDRVEAEWPLYTSSAQVGQDGGPVITGFNETSWSSFHKKVLAPNDLTWAEWCSQGASAPTQPLPWTEPVLPAP